MTRTPAEPREVAAQADRQEAVHPELLGEVRPVGCPVAAQPVGCRAVVRGAALVEVRPVGCPVVVRGAALVEVRPVGCPVVVRGAALVEVRPVGCPVVVPVEVRLVGSPVAALGEVQADRQEAVHPADPGEAHPVEAAAGHHAQE